MSHPSAADGTDVRVGAQPYVLSPSRWPSAQTTITYSFADRTFGSDSDREEHLGAEMDTATQGIVRQAMDTWEAVCGVRFVEVADSPSANVRIAWTPSVAPAAATRSGRLYHDGRRRSLSCRALGGP